MKLQDIQDLIKMVSRLGVTEVEIEQKDFKLTIKSEGKRKKGVEYETTVIQTPHSMGVPQVQMPSGVPQAAPVIETTPQAASEEKVVETAKESDKYVTVKSPMIGTFYRASGPDKDAFVNVGDSIKQGRLFALSKP